MRRALAIRFRVTTVSAVAVILIGFSVPATAATLDPATFDEYVGITGGTILGADLAIAELVNLSITNEQNGDRGSGDGFSRPAARCRWSPRRA